ncbi:MAG: 3-keto-5-aminohexanoate cleavage protein [Myxococcota bacterium]|nr:3-keto-5-aminohexanoate cleavage protein [Myxococcota bacterium]
MSKLHDKVIITAALNGTRLHRGTCPTVPYSPAEIAAEAQRAANAGAAIVHFCARESGGAISHRVEAVQETVSAINVACAARTSITAVDPTVPVEDRLKILDARPDRALVAIGSITTAKFNYSRRRFDYDAVDGGTFSDATKLIEQSKVLGIQPVLLCQDLGQIEALTPLAAMGVLPNMAEVQLRFGGVGHASPFVRNLVHLSTSVPPEFRWHAAVRSSSPWAFLGAALAAGGHLRVGLEDCRYTPEGTTAESSAVLVDAAVRIIRAVGLQVAQPTDLE